LLSPSAAWLAKLLVVTTTLAVAWCELRLSGGVLAADPPSQPIRSPAKAGGRNAAASKAALFAEAVAEVRKAMIQRDLAAARKHLGAASENAQSSEDRDQVDRLQTMLDYLNQFWGGIRGAMAKLSDAEEIVAGGVRAIVVESGRDALAIKVSGRIHRYSFETLPTSLVMMLVERHFGKDVDSRAVIATFLAVDPQGDRATAKKYWQEAAKADIDTEKLLVELNQFPLTPKRTAPVGQGIRDKGLGIRD
jgi:hypothetical protein